MQVREVTSPRPPGCPYCREGVLQGEPCPDCGTRYHDDCWAELSGRCAVMGCGGRQGQAPRVRPAGQATRPQRAIPTWLAVALALVLVFAGMLFESARRAFRDHVPPAPTAAASHPGAAELALDYRERLARALGQAERVAAESRTTADLRVRAELRLRYQSLLEEARSQRDRIERLGQPLVVKGQSWRRRVNPRTQAYADMQRPQVHVEMRHELRRQLTHLVELARAAEAQALPREGSLPFVQCRTQANELLIWLALSGDPVTRAEAEWWCGAAGVPAAPNPLVQRALEGVEPLQSGPAPAPVLAAQGE